MSGDLTVGLFVCLLVLFGVGLGPALALLRGVSRRAPLALALAPALALALTAILGLPLIMVIGPAARWAWPLAAALLALSAGLILWERRRDPALFSDIRLPTLLEWAGVFLIGLAILWAPALAMGAQYTAFRSNPGDSFTYMTLAETVRKVDWEVIRAGSVFTAANIDNLARLAAESPTALYSARLLGRSFPLNHVANLAWLAQLAGVSTPQFYFPFHIILSATMLPAVVALGFQARVRRWLLALAALAATTGFWMRLVIETDASAELGAAPLLALAVFGWMLIARARGSTQTQQGLAPIMWRWRLLVAIPWAALAVVYRPLGALIVIAVVLHLLYDIFILRDAKGWLTSYAPTALVALFLLLMTGQMTYHLPAFVDPLGRAEAEAGFDAAAFDLLTTDKLGALAGLPVNYLLRGVGAGITIPLSAPAQLVGLTMAALWAFGLWCSVRSLAQGKQRALFFIGLAGALMFVLFWLTQNQKAAGKAYTYTYAYLFLGMVIGADTLANRLRPRRRRVVLIFMAVWLVALLLVGAFTPFDSRAAGRFARARANRAGYSLDLQPIASALDRSDPGLVLVDVPRDERFFFALYVMLAMSDYPTHFLSGLIIDGDIRYQNLWPGELNQRPSYAMVLRSADYLANAQFARKIVETDNLRLYALTSDETKFFQQKEREIRTKEEEKAVFPSLASQ